MEILIATPPPNRPPSRSAENAGLLLQGGPPAPRRKSPEGVLPPQRITTSRARRPIGALPIEIGVP